jgi:hypothetical protein
MLVLTEQNKGIVTMVWWLGGPNFKKRTKRSAWEVPNKASLVPPRPDAALEVTMVILEGGMRG